MGLRKRLQLPGAFQSTFIRRRSYRSGNVLKSVQRRHWPLAPPAVPASCFQPSTRASSSHTQVHSFIVQRVRIEAERVGAPRQGHVFKRRDCDPARDLLYLRSSEKKKTLPLVFFLSESRLGKAPLRSQWTFIFFEGKFLK